MTIGNFCVLGDNLSVITSNHDARFANIMYEAALRFGWSVPMTVPTDIRIGSAVWIGDAVTVLPGASIGDGAVIAAGSVVRGPVRPFEIVGGVPARHIRFRYSDDVVDYLLRLRWWEWDERQLRANREFFDADLTGSELDEIRAMVRM